MSLEAIRYSSGRLQILDQLLLPQQSLYIDIKNVKDGWKAIRLMQVRGAPAIAVVGILSLAVELSPLNFSSVEELIDIVTEKLDYLKTSRPTAVNLADAAKKLQLHIKKSISAGCSTDELKTSVITFAEEMLCEDVKTNKTMSAHGAEHILRLIASKPATILTHCNTGSLATAGYGTALGVVRSLSERGQLAHCYCTETRPYNQGARLTAYELVYEKLPSTLICDSMVGALLASRGISAVVTGADRVAANGDTANKIGTYQIAVLAQFHNVPFFIIAPTTSIDLSIASGTEIVIEERPHAEMTQIAGVDIAAKGIGCWNPAFDVTPAPLIAGIVTEYGVFKPEELKDKLNSLGFES